MDNKYKDVNHHYWKVNEMERDLINKTYYNLHSGCL